MGSSCTKVSKTTEGEPKEVKPIESEEVKAGTKEDELLVRK